MKEYCYCIILEYLVIVLEGQFLYVFLSFEVGNYDDIFSIVVCLCGNGQFDSDISVQLVLGLKLFLEVMFKNCKYLLFEDIQLVLCDFIMKLKLQGKVVVVVQGEFVVE